MKHLLLILLLATTACSKQTEPVPVVQSQHAMYFDAVQQTGSILCKVTLVKTFQGDTFYMFKLTFTDWSIQNVQVKVQAGATTGSWTFPTTKMLKSWVITGS